MRKSLSLLPMFTILLAGSFSFAAGKGKPGGGGTEEPPPPPLPPIRYWVSYLDTPSNTLGQWYIGLGQINIHGDYVGNYENESGVMHGFAVTQGVSVDLNDIGVEGIPDGSEIRSAVDINDDGIIVGALGPIGDPNQIRRGFVLDVEQDPPQLATLPDADFGPYTYARRINNTGDVQGAFLTESGAWGTYLYNPGIYSEPDPAPEVLPFPIVTLGELNNRLPNAPAQLIGSQGSGGDSVPFRYTRGGQTEILDVVGGVTISNIKAINDAGLMAGSTVITNQINRNRATYTTYPIRFTATDVEVLADTMNMAATSGFNNSGDMLLTAGDLLQSIYRDDWGLVNLSDAVIGTSADVDLWTTSASRRFFNMTDRVDVPGTTEQAGIISGCSTYDGVVRYFVLFPVAAP